MRPFIAIMIAITAFCPCAFAKAYFQTMREMIERAESIAIIVISDVHSGNTQGKTWVYRRVGHARTESILKGDLPKDFDIYGSETFICAQCPLQNGTFLAFLKKDGDLWTGSNWHLSLRPIHDDMVDWYISEDNRYEMKATPLKAIINEIKKNIG